MLPEVPVPDLVRSFVPFYLKKINDHSGVKDGRQHTKPLRKHIHQETFRVHVPSI